MTEPSLARRGLDRLLARYPLAEIEQLDWQFAQRLLTTEYLPSGAVRAALSTEVGGPGPWVCVDFTSGEKFAIWKETGAVYRVGADGAVEDDPLSL